MKGGNNAMKNAQPLGLAMAVIKPCKAKDVLVLHAGSLQRICDTLIEGFEA